MDAKQLREAFGKHGIKKVKIGGFDLDGVLRGKYVSLDKFWSAVEGGLGFCDVIFGWDIADVLYDNARVTGWHTGYPDTHATIDLDTFRVLPWEKDTAAFLVDFVHEDGTPHAACPRSLLKGILARAKALGLSATFACEFEFFLFKETSETLHQKGFRGSRRCRPGCSGTRGSAKGRTRSCATRSSTTWSRSTSRSRGSTRRPARGCTRWRSATTKRSGWGTKRRSSRRR